MFKVMKFSTEPSEPKHETQIMTRGPMYRTKRLHLSIPKIEQNRKISPQKNHISLPKSNKHMPKFEELKVNGISQSQRIVPQRVNELTTSHLSHTPIINLNRSSLLMSISHQSQKSNYNPKKQISLKCQRIIRLSMPNIVQPAVSLSPIRYNFIITKKEVKEDKQSYILPWRLKKHDKQGKKSKFLKLIGIGCKLQSHLLKQTAYLKYKKNQSKLVLK